MESNVLPPCSRTICVSPPGGGACIELVDVKKLNEDDNFLVCPSCWHTVTKGKKECSPYVVRIQPSSIAWRTHLTHHLHKALYLQQSKKGIEPNPVVVVNRRTLAFFPHLKMPNTLLLDISHQDFTGYRMAYNSIKVSLAEFTNASRVVKHKTIDLNCIKNGYNSEVNEIQTWIEKWASCYLYFLLSHPIQA